MCIRDRGWLAVALVIFTTWKPLNAIWGAYLFGMLYWLYQFLPTLLGITLASYMTDLVQMLPYVVTIVAVSYTHLDVYKRQVCCRRRFLSWTKS